MEKPTTSERRRALLSSLADDGQALTAAAALACIAADLSPGDPELACIAMLALSALSDARRCYEAVLRSPMAEA